LFALQQLAVLRVSFADFRLVKYDSVHEYIERSFDDEWDSSISLVLGGVKSIYTFDLLAETKQPHEQFEPCYVGGLISVTFCTISFLSDTEIRAAFANVQISLCIRPTQCGGGCGQTIGADF